MKRAFIFLISLVLAAPRLALAQDTSTTGVSAPAPSAAGVAEREAAEERAKRVAADIEALQAASDAFQTKLTAMEQEIQTLREAQAHAADNSGWQDAAKTLAEKIQEVDKKREEDKAAIADEIRKSIGGLEKSLSSNPSPTRSTVKAPPSTDSSVLATGGYSYTIQNGDRLYLIVKAYNKEFQSKGMKSITSKQVRDANPNIDWNRLRVGQKIVVPMPAGG